MSNDACAGLSGCEIANEIERDAIARSTPENPAPVTGLTWAPFGLLAEHLRGVQSSVHHIPEWVARWPDRPILNCRGFPVILVRQPREVAHD